jgi:predicted ATP-dependent serine protease
MTEIEKKRKKFKCKNCGRDTFKQGYCVNCQQHFNQHDLNAFMKPIPKKETKDEKHA